MYSPMVNYRKIKLVNKMWTVDSKIKLFLERVIDTIKPMSLY